MDNPEPRRSAYALLQFTLDRDTEGKPTQRTTPHGDFESIEAAFAAARLNATRSFTRITASNFEQGGNASQVVMHDTEWGYDIRVNHLTVVRYWVHDRQAAEVTSV
ncbi:MAG TPA: hypothetical protein VGD88_12435 [Opitutaceae bacterium]